MNTDTFIDGHDTRDKLAAIRTRLLAQQAKNAPAAEPAETPEKTPYATSSTTANVPSPASTPLSATAVAAPAQPAPTVDYDELFRDLKERVAAAKADGDFNRKFKTAWKGLVESYFGSPIEADVLNWATEEWRLSHSDTFRYRQRIRTIEDLGAYPDNADTFVDAYAQSKGLKVRLDCVQGKFELLTLAEFNNDLYAYNVDYGLRIDKHRLEIAAEKWHKRGLTEYLFALSKSVSDPEAQKPGTPKNAKANGQLERVVAIIDKNEHRRALTKAVLLHFMWNVKRVMRPFDALPTKNPIMPVLTGPTGNGKSTAVRSLLLPFKNGGYAETAFDKLIDSNFYNEAASVPIAFLDEMARLSNVDAQSLKAFITSDTVRARRFHTQIIESKTKIIQPIGTSNYSLDSISTDTTSARRFYEIETGAEMKSANPYWYETIDWLLIWQSVNPDAPDPLNDQLGNELFDIQHNEQRRKNYVEEWLEAENVHGSFRAAELYGRWYEWAETNDKYHWQRANVTNFGRTLTAISFPANAAGATGVRKWYDAKGTGYDIP